MGHLYDFPPPVSWPFQAIASNSGASTLSTPPAATAESNGARITFTAPAALALIWDVALTSVRHWLVERWLLNHLVDEDHKRQ